MAAAEHPYDRLRRICMALPESTERPMGGHVAPAWRVRNKIFCGTHQVGRPAMFVKGAPGAQEQLTATDRKRYFVPDYVGSNDWVGAYLDAGVDWKLVAELVEESYRRIAPKTLVMRLDALSYR